MKEIQNIYPDEQKKLDDDSITRLAVMFHINELLDSYGYDLVAEIDNGLPKMNLIKLG